MNYNTHVFVLIFLPVVLSLFYTVPVKLRIPVLCAASLVFYGASGLIPLVFLLLSILWGYVTAFSLARKKTPFRIFVAVSFPLAVLFSFKYLNFALNTFGAGSEVREKLYFLLSVVMPAGISFYTFQIFAYSDQLRL